MTSERATARENAREELAAKLRATPITARRSSWLQTVDAVLAHPDLVLRALGMERVGFASEIDPSYDDEDRPIWVEPPPDSGAET